MQHATIDATSPFLRDYIGNHGEALQLLHHSYTYDSEFVRHVVGSTHGEIISSVRVRFSGYIREGYGKCLQELKDFILPWAYDHTNSSIPEDVLQLAAISLKDIVGGHFGLVQQFILWKRLLLCPLPLPPLCRMIPMIHAEWNVKKTASDTITQMIDGSCNQIIPPITCINGNILASARIINYSLVTCHRLQQLFSS
jgi:hypothetical protein